MQQRQAFGATSPRQSRGARHRRHACRRLIAPRKVLRLGDGDGDGAATANGGGGVVNGTDERMGSMGGATIQSPYTKLCLEPPVPDQTPGTGTAKVLVGTGDFVRAKRAGRRTTGMISGRAAAAGGVGEEQGRRCEGVLRAGGGGGGGAWMTTAPPSRRSHAEGANRSWTDGTITRRCRSRLSCRRRRSCRPRWTGVRPYAHGERRICRKQERSQSEDRAPSSSTLRSLVHFLASTGPLSA